MTDTPHRLATVPLGLHHSLGYSQVRGGGATGSAAASIEADRVDAVVVLGPGGTYAGGNFAHRCDSSAWTAFAVLSYSWGSGAVPIVARFVIDDAQNDGFVVQDDAALNYIHVRTAATRSITLGNTTNDPLLIWNSDGAIQLAGAAPSIDATATNDRVRIRGNRSAADTAADVIVASTATRTAGEILAVVNNATTVFEVNFSGGIIQIGGAVTTGLGTALVIDPGTWSGQTAGSETIAIDLDLAHTVTHASNTAIATQRDALIRATTHAFASATGTITDAATLAISGPPIAGSNAVITNPYSLWIQAGNARFAGDVVTEMVHAIAATGTNQGTAIAVAGGSASGTDQVGGATEIRGGRGTGIGSGGAVHIFTAPAGATGAALNALRQRFSVDSEGDVSITPRSNSQSLGIRALTELHTLAAAATSDTTIQVPQGALVLYVTMREVANITTSGASNTAAMGVAGDSTRYGNGLGGPSHVGLDSAGTPRFYTTAAAIRFTAPGAETFTGGQLRVTIHYIDAAAAAS